MKKPKKIPKCKFKVGDIIKYKKIINEYTGYKYRPTFSHSFLVQKIEKIKFITEMGNYRLWLTNGMWVCDYSVKKVTENSIFSTNLKRHFANPMLALGFKNFRGAFKSKNNV